MERESDDLGGMAVPSGRLQRISRFGALATGVAGDVAWHGARELVSGRRPAWRDLLLTPANATRFADQLARMRGAAMKMGQLLSMEAGDVLPPELADILARLRADAKPMPPAQLKGVLTAAWGRDFTRRFKRFDPRPIAAASIGQVHRAETKDGRQLAVKVQYPGVRESIDSDVANVAALIRVSGLVPRGVDLDTLLEEARRQLHDEADYVREGRDLARFAALMAGDPAYRVPELAEDFTTERILAMSFEPGMPIDALAEADQATRDRVMTRLFDLMLRELFAFGAMQTDPNFANYRYDPETDRVVLLDFGATRDLPAALVAEGRALLRAAHRGDRPAWSESVERLGLIGPESSAPYRAALLDMVEIALTPLAAEGGYDFARSEVPRRLRAAGMALAEQTDEVHVPPIDLLYLQRKVGGMFLLAQRLGARVDVGSLSRAWI